MSYQEYLDSLKWQAIRKAILDSVKACQRCQFPYELNVHHLTYERLGNELASDLEVLCKGCHMREHVTDVEAALGGIDISVLRDRIKERTRKSYEKNIEREYEFRRNQERDKELE